MNDNQTIRRKTIGSPIRAGNQSESPVQSQQVPADMTMQSRKSVYVPGSKASDPTELENRIIIYWLNHAFWDATQEQIGKDLEELLQIDQQTELSADTGIEIARQWQLTSLLRQLQVETCEVQYQGKQDVKIWLSDYGTEISGYLI